MATPFDAQVGLPQAYDNGALRLLSIRDELGEANVRIGLQQLQLQPHRFGSILDDAVDTYYYSGNRHITTFMGGEAFHPIGLFNNHGAGK